MTIQELIDALNALPDKDRPVILAADHLSGIFSTVADITDTRIEYGRHDVFSSPPGSTDIPEAAIPAVILWPNRESIDD